MMNNGNLPHCGDFVDQYLKNDQVPDLQQLLKDDSSSTQRAQTPGKEVFQLKESIELPKSLVNEMQKDSYEWGFMGIFPDIQYVWATLDTNIYLFNYGEFQNEYISYTDLDQVIIAVSLVNPKPDVFVEDVKHILVLATPVEIILLAVVYQEDGKISLLPSNLSVPSDNVNMLKITGTDDGRIFLCGKDGNLYEVGYQSGDSWFRKKCWKTNHTQTFASSCVPSFLKLAGEDPLIDAVYDEHRKLLYTLSANSSIQLFDLGEDGDQLVRAGMISNMRSSCLRLWSDAKPDSSMFALKSISVVGVAESSAIHLMGVTASGIRLYFSTVPRRYRKKLCDGPRDAQLFREISPSCLELVHIRTPPPRDENNRRNILGEYSQIDTLCYSEGACIITDTSQDDENLLLICTAPAVSINQHELKERVAFIEIKTEFAWTIENSRSRHAKNRYCGNELATQHVIPAPELLCLTQDGIQRIVKLRPVDELYALLRDSQGQQTTELNDFFQFYKGEACAMCLIIICAHQQRNVLPLLENTSFSSNVLQIEGSRSSDIARLAEASFFNYGGDPNYKTETHIANAAVGFHPTIDLSNKFHGISMFLSRILAPLWKRSAFVVSDAREFSFSNTGKDKTTIPCVISPSLTPLELVEIQELLIRLDSFRQNSSHFAALAPAVPKAQQTPMNTPIARRTTPTRSMTDGSYQAKKQEEESLRNVFQLLTRSMEAISLIQLLSFPLQGNRPLVLGIIEAALGDIVNTSFQEIVCSNSLPCVNVLISALIKTYSESFGNIEMIAGSLNDRCSSYFSLSSMKLHRVVEELKKLKPNTFVDHVFRDTCREMLPIAGEVDISPVLKIYEEFGYFSGFVQLLLTRASKIDPSDLANQGAHDDKLREEKRDQRLQCYAEIIRLYRTQKDSDSRQVILNTVLQTDDKLCHYTLFLSYLEQEKNGKDPNALSELLALNSVYLEDFLHDNSDQLLYRFYCIRERFGEAASVAHRLSKASRSLQERVDWLVDSIHSENACGGGNPSGNDVHMLHEELDVAKIQMRIYNQIQSSSQLDASAKKVSLARLDSNLLGLSDLFNDFARPLQLWEIQLIIFHSAGHMDPNRVKDCWMHIIGSKSDINVLEKKILALGETLYPSEWAFPVDFLCEKLETLNARVNDISDLNYSWVVALMINIGVSFETLFAIYENQINKAATLDEKLAYIVPMTRLIEHWLEGSKLQGVTPIVSQRVAHTLQNCAQSITGNGKLDPTIKGIISRLQYLASEVSKIHQNIGF